MLSKSHRVSSKWISSMLNLAGTADPGRVSGLTFLAPCLGSDRYSIPRLPCHSTFLLFCSLGMLLFAQPLRFFGLATSRSAVCALALDYNQGLGLRVCCISDR